MSILVNRDTRLLVQGITGREGAFHTGQMLAYGTKVVAGVTPGHGGEEVAGVPVFHTVKEAVEATAPNVSIIYVPALAAPEAMFEAAEAGIPLIVCITERIPTLDMIRVVHYVNRNGCRLIGPNCPGVITPGQAKVGIMPGHIHRPGPIGVVSRSGTLTYEVVKTLSDSRLGQSTCVGIGGDAIIGSSFVDILALFEEDPQTEAVVLIGEIGGTDEEQAAEYVASHFSKPVVGFVVGLTAPEGKRMGHAGAIISGGTGTAQGKIADLKRAGVTIVDSPTQVGSTMKELLTGRRGAEESCHERPL